MKIFGKEYDEKRVKKIAYIAVAVIVVGWFIFRFAMVIIENRMQVFNPIRDEQKNGVLVQTVAAKIKDGVIKVPLVVKNNRAYVSPNRLGKFRAGQNIGNGKITYVSQNLDYDSGMYIVKTSGVSDGLNYAEIKMRGVFIPVYAVRGDVVMVVNDGVADARSVTVAGQDSTVACVTGGLNDGDVVILSNVDADKKINIKE